MTARWAGRNASSFMSLPARRRHPFRLGRDHSYGSRFSCVILTCSGLCRPFLGKGVLRIGRRILDPATQRCSTVDHSINRIGELLPWNWKNASAKLGGIEQCRPGEDHSYQYGTLHLAQGRRSGDHHAQESARHYPGRHGLGELSSLSVLCRQRDYQRLWL